MVSAHENILSDQPELLQRLGKDLSFVPILIYDPLIEVYLADF